MFLMKKCRTSCLVDRDTFRYKYENVLQELKDSGMIATITSYVNEKIFPDRNMNLFEYFK